MLSDATSDSEPPPAPGGRLPALSADKLYYSMAECAAITGWSVQRTREHLEREGAIVKRGKYFYTTKHLLRRGLPEEAGEWLAHLEANRRRTKGAECR